jgi:hypothetical protein
LVYASCRWTPSSTTGIVTDGVTGGGSRAGPVEAETEHRTGREESEGAESEEPGSCSIGVGRGLEFLGPSGPSFRLCDISRHEEACRLRVLEFGEILLLVGLNGNA